MEASQGRGKDTLGERQQDIICRVDPYFGHIRHGRPSSCNRMEPSSAEGHCGSIGLLCFFFGLAKGSQHKKEPEMKQGGGNSGQPCLPFFGFHDSRTARSCKGQPHTLSHCKAAPPRKKHHGSGHQKKTGLLCMQGPQEDAIYRHAAGDRIIYPSPPLG